MMSHTMRFASVVSLAIVALANFTLRSASTQTMPTVRSIPIMAYDIAYDPVSQKIFATLPSTSEANPNSVQVIDPQTATKGAVISVGSNPQMIAVSDDGQYLYVSLAGEGAIRRVHLPTLKAETSFKLSDGLRLSDLETVPGSSSKVVAAGLTPYGTLEMTLYENGIARASTPGISQFEITPSSRLYGINSTSYSSEFVQLDITSSGFANKMTAPTIINGYRLAFDNGLLYSSSGRVIHPEQQHVIGQYAKSGLVEPVSAWNRTFVLNGSTLYVFNQQTLLPIGSITVTSQYGEELVELIHYGSNHLAAISRYNLYLIDISEFLTRPTNLQAEAGGQTRINLMWSDNSTGEAGFRVERSANGIDGWQQVGTSTAANFADTSVACDLSYHYRVYPYWSDGRTAARSTSVMTRTLPCTAQPAVQFREIPITANDILYDPTTRMIYASLPSTAGAAGNSIQVIDPVTGVKGAAVFVGSEPDRLALSDDRKYLYIDLSGAGAVRRLLLPSMTAEPAFWLGNSCSAPCAVDDVDVMPGNANAIAVARRPVGGQGHAGVAIFENGVQRTTTTGGLYSDGPNAIEFGSATEIYGHEPGQSYYRLALNPGGVTVSGPLKGFASVSSDVEFDNGRLYNTSGEMVLPNAAELQGTYSTGGLIEPVSKWNRMFIYWDETLHIFNQETFTRLGTIVIPNTGDDVSTLIHWGDKGVALLTPTKIVLVDVSTYLTRPTNLQATSGGPTRTDLIWNDNFTDEAGYRIERTLTTSTAWQQIATTTGATYTDTSVSCNTQYKYRVFAYWADGSKSGASNTPTIKTGDCSTNAPLIRDLSLTANDVIYDPVSQKLYVSLPGTAGAAGNSIRAVDPVTGALEKAVYVGSEPGVMAVSDNGQYLYVLLKGASMIQRLSLPSMTPDLRIPLGTSCREVCFGYDIAVMPGNAEVVAVSRRGLHHPYEILALFNNGIAVSSASSTLPGSTAFEFISQTRLLGASHMNRSQIPLLDLNTSPNSATLTQTLEGFLNYPQSILEYDNGLIYSSSGQVIHPDGLRVVGTFGGGPTIEPVSELNRLFVGTQKAIYIDDQQTLTRLGVIPMPTASSPLSLIHAGGSYLALLTETKLHLIDVSKFVFPPISVAVLSAAGSRIDLGWQYIGTDPVEFRIEWSLDYYGPYEEIGRSSTTSFVDRRAYCSARNYYRIRSQRVSDGRFSEYSEPIYRSPNQCPPVAYPTELTATPINTESILVTWKDNATNEGTYYVYYNSTHRSGLTWFILPANTESYVIENLTCGPTYFIEVTPHHAHGYEGGSAETSVALPCTLPTPARTPTPAVSPTPTITPSPTPIPSSGITLVQTATGIDNGWQIITREKLLANPNSLYLAALTAKPGTSSVSLQGLGLEWRTVLRQCSGRGQTMTQVWVGVGKPVESDYVRASSGEGAVLTVQQYTGVDLEQPIGAVVGRNTVGVNDTICVGGTDSASYAATIAASSPGALIYSAVALFAQTHTSGAGFTEIMEPHSGTITGIAIQNRVVTSPQTITVNGSMSSSMDWAVVALELRPASSGTPVVTATPQPTATPTIMVTHAPTRTPTAAPSATPTAVAPTPTRISSATATITPPSSQGLTTGFYQDNHSALAYTGVWTVDNNAAASGGQYRYSNSPTAGVSFTFIGNKLTLYRAMAFNRGPMSVCIDGLCQTIQNYSASVMWQAPISLTVTQGVHTVEIRNASSAYIDLDAVRVESDTSAPTVMPSPTSMPSVTPTALPTATPALTATAGPSSTPSSPSVITYHGMVSGLSTVSASVRTDAPVEAVPSSLYLAVIASRGSRRVTALTGMGLNWTHIAAQCGGRAQTQIEIWEAHGSPSASEVVTATFSSAPNSTAMTILRYSGVDLSQPIGAVLGANTLGTGSATCTGGTDSAAYRIELAGISPNAVIVGGASIRNRTHAAGAGYTEFGEIAAGSSGEMTGLAVQHAAVSGLASHVFDGKLSGIVDWAALAVELRPATTTATGDSEPATQPSVEATSDSNVQIDPAPTDPSGTDSSTGNIPIGIIGATLLCVLILGRLLIWNRQ